MPEYAKLELLNKLTGKQSDETEHPSASSASSSSATEGIDVAKNITGIAKTDSIAARRMREYCGAAHALGGLCYTRQSVLELSQLLNVCFVKDVKDVKEVVGNGADNYHNDESGDAAAAAADDDEEMLSSSLSSSKEQQQQQVEDKVKKALIATFEWTVAVSVPHDRRRGREVEEDGGESSRQTTRSCEGTTNSSSCNQVEGEEEQQKKEGATTTEDHIGDHSPRSRSEQHCCWGKLAVTDDYFYPSPSDDSKKLTAAFHPSLPPFFVKLYTSLRLLCLLTRVKHHLRRRRTGQRRSTTTHGNEQLQVQQREEDDEEEEINHAPSQLEKILDHFFNFLLVRTVNGHSLFKNRDLQLISQIFASPAEVKLEILPVSNWLLLVRSIAVGRLSSSKRTLALCSGFHRGRLAITLRLHDIIVQQQQQQVDSEEESIGDAADIALAVATVLADGSNPLTRNMLLGSAKSLIAGPNGGWQTYLIKLSRRLSLFRTSLQTMKSKKDEPVCKLVSSNLGIITEYINILKCMNDPMGLVKQLRR